MIKTFLLLIALLMSFTVLNSAKTVFKHSGNRHMIRYDGYAQGTTWHVTYYAPDTLVEKKQIDSLLLSIDSSLSIYKPFSIISKFNRSVRGTIIDPHLRNVVEKSLETYSQTKGLFDITVLPLVEAWGFGAKEYKSLLDSTTIRHLRSCVGSGKLVLRGNNLIKRKSCVRIDVNGIAQGYTVDVIYSLLSQRMIKDFIVEVGGELRVHGMRNPPGEPFRVGIEAPADNEFEQGLKFEKILTVDSGAITTSGSYRKYRESNGRKLSHLINPYTGYPVQNELISVTVYADDAITADAYDNALMLMGLKDALQFIGQHKNIDAFFIYKSPDGRLKDTASKRFYNLIRE